MAAVRIDPDFARRRTGELMSRAQREIPLFHVHKQAAAGRLRAAARTAGVSVTVALLPLVARWLTRHPLLNAHWTDEGLAPRERVDLGVAWAHRENVLVVPALRDWAGWSTTDFATEMRDLRERSRADAFRTTDFATPSFTVSNLGASGIDAFTSLVTPPQTGVLSLSAIVPRPVVVDGALAALETLPLTLGVDHRAIDGAAAATALADLVTTIEEDRA